MKKLYILFLLACISNYVNSQTTYYWVGGTGSTTWSAATWSTTFGGTTGSGTRVAGTTDTLIIDGSNLGSGTTGAFTILSIPTQTIGNLVIRNGAAVTFSNTASTATLTIGGTATANDFTISSNSSLTLGGTQALTIAVSTGAKALISGSLIFNGSSGTPAHRFTTPDAQGITFSGSSAIFTQGAASAGNAFGTTAVGTNNNVVFANGSLFEQIGGGNPFGAAAPASVVQFQTGSKYVVKGTISPNLNSRTYANLEYNTTSNIVANVTSGTTVSIDTLIITSIGSGTTSLGSTGATAANLNIKGNVQFNHSSGTFSFGASSATLAVNFNGSVAQTLSGAGTVTITNSGGSVSTTFNVKNGANLTINKTAIGLGAATTTAFTVESGGRLNMTNENTITGSGAIFNLNSGATLAIGSVGGISGTTTAGNIRTATQNYSTSANYIYNYNADGGATGAGLPSSVNNLTLSNSGTIALTNASLTVNGLFTISNTGTPTLLNVNNKSFALGNSATGVIEAGATIFDYVLSGTGGTINFNNRSITLKSSLSGTARIGQIQGTLSGATNVTVERYIPAGKRAYRLLTPIVTTSTSIRANWQEGVNNTSLDYASNQNPNPGYGTHITGSTTGANGFDATLLGNKSLQIFNNSTQSWSGISNTNSTTLSTGSAYLLMIRGNRSFDLNTVSSTTNTATTLRATGTLISGQIIMNSTGLGATVGMPLLSATPSHFNLIGNPYASPLSWALLKAQSTDVTSYYYIWDPTLGSRGAYVSCHTDGTKSNSSSNITTDIQSGQAFFVRNTSTITTGPSLVFQQAQVTNTSTNVFGLESLKSKLNLQLYLTANYPNGVSQDGATVIFSKNYNSGIDDNDAGKFMNQDENLAIQNSNNLLSIEQRNIVDGGTDTLHLSLTQTQSENYSLVIDGSNFGSTQRAYLVDYFLNKEQEINLDSSTIYNFSINTNDIGSSNASRFKIIFKPNTILPVTLTNLLAYKFEKNVSVEWTTTNESNIDFYEVEKSKDGLNFTSIGKLSAKNANHYSYQLIDKENISGNNYYRLRIYEKSGIYQISRVVSVYSTGSFGDFKVLNNPNKTGVFELKLMNFSPGNYLVKMFSTDGKLLYSSNFIQNDGNGSKQINTSAFSKGTYYISISNAEGFVITKSILNN